MTQEDRPAEYTVGARVRLANAYAHGDTGTVTKVYDFDPFMGDRTYEVEDDADGRLIEVAERELTLLGE